MKSTGTSYNHLRSFERLDELLDGNDSEYEERDNLPPRDDLTFTNGVYAKAVCVFIDIRKSSELPAKYAVPALAKLYRAFISEVVAVLDGETLCDEINIVGDGVWGVFEGNLKAQLDRVVEAVSKVSSLLDAFNDKLVARGYERIYVGIGVDWGRALIIKSGYSGSGINDVVYMGNVVNSAAKLSSYGEQLAGLTRRPRIIAGSAFVSNLESQEYRKFFTHNPTLGAYTASLINTAMSDAR